jgi:hypothetical protein
MYQTWVGNPYDVFNEGDVICVTTNGEIKKDGYAVMGRGSAQFARDTFHVDQLLGQYISKYGNRVFSLGKHQYNEKSFVMLTFPTKNGFRGKSDINLIETSAKQIKAVADKYHLKKIYIPIPGCSNGHLKWKQVKERLRILDERFIIYSLEESSFML